jgi:hypothetical protein
MLQTQGMPYLKSHNCVANRTTCAEACGLQAGELQVLPIGFYDPEISAPELV